MLLPKYFKLILAPLLFVAFTAHPLPAGTDAAASLAAAPESLIGNGAYVLTKEGKYIATHNPDNLYVPASILKIATALAALDVLGPSFRFSTNFYLDDQKNLYIKGFGDPFLISEEVALIAARLKEHGCQAVRNIYIDDSSFSIPALTEGAGLSDNPYDAQNSGLAVNFNTVNINKDQFGRAHSAEEQTPTLPMMAKLAEDLAPGVHRINITRTDNNGAAIISRYVGELFRAFLQQENVAATGIIGRRKTPESLAPFYRHRSSKPLQDIIGPLMLYSNNFIANQLFLAVGAARYGYPATWDKGRKAMEDILRGKFGLSPREIMISEGSGLSRKNRVTARAMIRLLDAFKPFSALLPQHGDVRAKSGTLQGVYSFAGYFTEKERLDSFVLLLNQNRNNRDAVLAALHRIYDAN